MFLGSAVRLGISEIAHPLVSFHNRAGTMMFDFDAENFAERERTWHSEHILSPAGLDFRAPDLTVAPRPSTARKAKAAGMKKISGRPAVATPRAPVRPPRALLTAVGLMKIAEADFLNEGPAQRVVH